MSESLRKKAFCCSLPSLLRMLLKDEVAVTGLLLYSIDTSTGYGLNFIIRQSSSTLWMTELENYSRGIYSSIASSLSSNMSCKNLDMPVSRRSATTTSPPFDISLNIFLTSIYLISLQKHIHLLLFFNPTAFH